MYSVYTLNDPRDNQVRYVGITRSIKSRYQGHLQDIFNKSKQSWIDGMASEGQLPIMIIIEKASDEVTARAREAHWIRHYYLSGCNLLNQEVINAVSQERIDFLLNQLNKRSSMTAKPQIVYLETQQSEQVQTPKQEEDTLAYWLAR